MLCRILRWEGRFCVFVTVASTFSGFRPWVRKYPSIFAHCLKYRRFWLKVFIDELLCMYLVFSGWICCSCFWVFFSGLKPTKDVRKRCLSMVLDIWYSTDTDWPRQLRRGWYWTRSQSMSSTDSVLDCYASRSVGGTVGVSRILLFFFRILRYLLG